MACPSPVLSDSDSHRRVMVSDHHYYLLRIGQIDPPIAFVTGTKTKPPQTSITVAITPGNATTVGHERPPAAWDTRPEARQGTFLRHEPTRRTCFYAAIRAPPLLRAVVPSGQDVAGAGAG